MFNIIQNHRGFAVYFIAVLVLVAMIGIALSITILAMGEYRISSNIVKSNQAYFTAEAGIEDAVYRIKKVKNFSSNYSMAIGSSSVNISIDSPNSYNRIITATGTIFNTFRKLETRLTITSINPQFFYGAQAGDLGIVMENNARIEGVGGVPGNVYSNGPIDGAPGATITGDAFVATGMSEDQKHTVHNSDQVFGSSSPIIDIAQSFRPATSSILTKISIYIKKVGNPGDRTVRILTDASGSPSTTSLASGTLQGSLVGNVYGWVDVVFASPPSLTDGETYWIMIDAVEDKNKYWYWGKDKNKGYGNGIAMYVEDWSVPVPGWTEIVGDLNFKTFMGGQATFLEDVIVFGDAHANTITTSRICGDAFYYEDNIDVASLNFVNGPGNPCPAPFSPGTAFPDSADPPLENMPISDSNINQWKQEAINGGLPHVGDLVVDDDMSFGPRKIEGNLIMSANKKTLTITGTVYVTGYIDISNGSGIRCSPAYDLFSCVIVTDKWVHLVNNGDFQGSGQPGSFLMILSTSLCDGTAPGDCTDFDAAIDVHNNVTGAIFYAHNGLIFLHNLVQASELTAKKLYLEQNAVIVYEQGLVNASFSAGPGGGWKVASWKEVE